MTCESLQLFTQSRNAEIAFQINFLIQCQCVKINFPLDNCGKRSQLGPLFSSGGHSVFCGRDCRLEVRVEHKTDLKGGPGCTFSVHV